MPNQWENGKYKRISFWINKTSERFLCVHGSLGDETTKETVVFREIGVSRHRGGPIQGPLETTLSMDYLYLIILTNIN